MTTRVPRLALLLSGLIAVALASGCTMESKARDEVDYFVKYGLRKLPADAQDPGPRIAELELSDLWREYGDFLVSPALDAAAVAASPSERRHAVQLLVPSANWKPRERTYRHMLEALFSANEFVSYAGQGILDRYLSLPSVREKGLPEALHDMLRGLRSPHSWVRINTCGLLIRNSDRRRAPIKTFRKMVETDPNFVVRLVVATQLYLLNYEDVDRLIYNVLATREKPNAPFIAGEQDRPRERMLAEINKVLTAEEPSLVSPVLHPHIVRGVKSIDLRVYVIAVARIVRADEVKPAIQHLLDSDSTDVRREADWVLRYWDWE